MRMLITLALTTGQTRLVKWYLGNHPNFIGKTEEDVVKYLFELGIQKDKEAGVKSEIEKANDDKKFEERLAKRFGYIDKSIIKKHLCNGGEIRGKLFEVDVVVKKY